MLYSAVQAGGSGALEGSYRYPAKPLDAARWNVLRAPFGAHVTGSCPPTASRAVDVDAFARRSPAALQTKGVAVISRRPLHFALVANVAGPQEN